MKVCITGSGLSSLALANSLAKDGIYVDATLGYGGHARLILEETSKKSRLLELAA